MKRTSPELETNRYLTIETPIGTMWLVARSGELIRVCLPGARLQEDESGVRLHHLDYEPILRETAVFLERYFNGVPVSWVGGFIPEGSTFQRKVWQAAARIPFGSTVSYGELAKRIDRPGAARAVAAAMAANPLPILIPCHRVIAADGGLGGYGGGLELKRWLLRHEGVVVK